MYFEMVAAKNMATHKFYILISSFVIITIRSFWFYNVISDAFNHMRVISITNMHSRKYWDKLISGYSTERTVNTGVSTLFEQQVH